MSLRELVREVLAHRAAAGAATPPRPADESVAALFAAGREVTPRPWLESRWTCRGQWRSFAASPPTPTRCPVERQREAARRLVAALSVAEQETLP